MDTRERIILELKKRTERLALLLKNSCKEQLICGDFCIGCEENSDENGNSFSNCCFSKLGNYKLFNLVVYIYNSQK